MHLPCGLEDTICCVKNRMVIADKCSVTHHTICTNMLLPGGLEDTICCVKKQDGHRR